MGDIDYKRFDRVLARCAEVAAEPNADAAVKLVYAGVLSAPSAAFRAAHQAVTEGASKFAKENKEAIEALAAVDQPFRVTRGVVLAFVPTLQLPETLKSQPTDTDRLTAIEDLQEALDDNVAEPWAAEQLAGPFAVAGPKAVKELTEAIAANKDLAAARTARSSAYGPAHDAYIAFKRVVREAMRPSSKQYQRIHVRANGALADDGDEGGGAPPPPAG